MKVVSKVERFRGGDDSGVRRRVVSVKIYARIIVFNPSHLSRLGLHLHMLRPFAGVVVVGSLHFCLSYQLEYFVPRIQEQFKKKGTSLIRRQCYRMTFDDALERDLNRLFAFLVTPGQIAAGTVCIICAPQLNLHCRYADQYI